MSKVVSTSTMNKLTNKKMISFLKVMYNFGYLPFTWINEDDSKFYDCKFEVSNLKTAFMFFLDFLLALSIPFYFYIWHLLNFGKDFNMSLLLKPSYYIELNDGVITTTLSQFIYFTFPSFAFWSYSFIGHGWFPLNKLLKKLWFELKYKWNLVGATLLVAGTLFHVFHVTEKFASRQFIEKGLAYYLPAIIIFGLICPRVMVSKFFYESLLLSILKGWTKARPKLLLLETTSQKEFQKMKQEVKEWIFFYQEISKVFATYLFLIICMSTCAIILTEYIIFTLPMAGHTIQESYTEYIGLSFLLIGFLIDYTLLVNGCHNAYDSINKLQSDMLLEGAREDSNEGSQSLLKERQEILIYILSIAKPLTGQGFFNVDRPMITSMVSAATTYLVVLVQFNMSEKPTSSCT